MIDHTNAVSRDQKDVTMQARDQITYHESLAERDENSSRTFDDENVALLLNLTYFGNRVL